MDDDAEKKLVKSQKSNVPVPTSESISKSKEDIIDAQVEEAIKDMPREIQKVFRVASSSSFSRGGGHPLFEKFNDNHIDKFLDYTQKDDDNDYKIRSSNRWFYLGYTMLSLAFFAFLIGYLLPTDKEMFKEVIKLGGVFLGGFGGGFGAKAYIERKNN